MPRSRSWGCCCRRSKQHLEPLDPRTTLAAATTESAPPFQRTRRSASDLLQNSRRRPVTYAGDIATNGEEKEAPRKSQSTVPNLIDHEVESQIGTLAFVQYRHGCNPSCATGISTGALNMRCTTANSLGRSPSLLPAVPAKAAVTMARSLCSENGRSVLGGPPQSPAAPPSAPPSAPPGTVPRLVRSGCRHSAALIPMAVPSVARAR